MHVVFSMTSNRSVKFVCAHRIAGCAVNMVKIENSKKKKNQEVSTGNVIRYLWWGSFYWNMLKSHKRSIMPIWFGQNKQIHFFHVRIWSGYDIVHNINPKITVSSIARRKWNKQIFSKKKSMTIHSQCNCLNFSLLEIQAKWEREV